MDKRIGFGLYQFCRNRGCCRGSVLGLFWVCFGFRWCEWFMWGVGGVFSQGLEG